MRGNINSSFYAAENFSHWTNRESENSKETQRYENKSPDHKKLLNQIIKPLPQNELNKFLSIGKIINLSAGENIYQYDDCLTHIYFPLSAVFSQLHVLEDGRTCETALIGREGCLGLSAASGVCKAEANYWIETTVGGTAWKVSAKNFSRAFDGDSAMRKKINEYFSFFTEQLMQKIVCNCFHSVRERFCSRLLMLRQRCLKNTLPGTQENIARALGTQRPSISCIASQFQKEKVITYSRGQITILDREKLQEFACECCTLFGEYAFIGD